jgi:hypothetical protein
MARQAPLQELDWQVNEGPPNKRLLSNFSAQSVQRGTIKLVSDMRASLDFSLSGKNDRH